MDLQITNVINISVSAAQAGLGKYNTSNLALMTRETAALSFGDDGYKLYLDPSDVATDFGTDSVTYKMALSIFSQRPNILAGDGYLCIILYLEGVDPQQTIALTGVAASGSFKLHFQGVDSDLIMWNDTFATIQAALRELPGLASVTVTGSIAGGSLVVTFDEVGAPVPLLTIVDNTLATSAPVPVTILVTANVAGGNETPAAAIARTESLIQYFGVLSAELSTGTEIAAAALVIQTLNKIAFWPRRDSASVDPGGVLDLLVSGSLHQNRGLFYGSETDLDCLLYAAAYAGRALSTNFSGSNTTQTMHLKDLIGVQPDPSMTQTLLNKCQAAGADAYVSIQGVAKTFTSGANKFFDQVYNLQAYVGQLEVNGFNALATSSTKLPQTEQGVAVLKGAYRDACEQFITNQFIGAGQWNDPTTFGNQGDFFRNISERGYYIYSAPVALQSQSDRVLRKAPLIQIAIKEAGAIHSSSVIIYVNA